VVHLERRANHIVEGDYEVLSASSLSENSALLQLKPKIEGTLAVDFDKGSANGCVS